MPEAKNRVPDSLPPLEIRVEHAGGSLKTCPNGFAASAIWGMTGAKPALPEKFLMEGSVMFELTKLEPVEGLKSIISGNPAVLYRADDYEIPMSPDELFRFAKHDLKPEEYFVLAKHWGLIHEIHDDFYDPDSGIAFQPMGGTGIIDDDEDEDAEGKLDS